MPVSFGGSNIPQDSARLFPWQVDHNCVRGGPNDPIMQQQAITTATPPATLGGGSVSWNTSFVMNPVPGQNPPTPRVMSLYANGTFASGAMTVNTTSGGLYLLTVPKGAWIQDVQMYCYTALTGSGFIGVFYAPASTDLTYPPGAQATAALSNMFLLCASTAAVATAGTLLSLKSGSGLTAFNTLTGASVELGPGNANPAATAPNVNQLASLDDMNIYVAAYGTGAPTGGSFAVMINFTGLEG